MKEYQPKKEKYNTLESLFAEMKDSGLSVIAFTGVESTTKTHRNTLTCANIFYRHLILV